MEQNERVRARPRVVRPVAVGTLAALADAELIGDAGRTEVTGVTMDSRLVEPGDLYVAVAGERTHGARFAADAIASGAAAIWTDPAGLESVPPTVPLMLSEDVRGSLGTVSAEAYGRPTELLGVLGITGTQGKTTTSYLAEAALRGAGAVPAVVGTIGTTIDAQPVPSALTTPEAPALQALFAAMVDYGVQSCAMEVSSHALVRGRVDAVAFDCAVFLNLGRDHLDFHADLEDYFAAKSRLFTPAFSASAVVSLDDDYGRRLAGESRIATHTMSTTGTPADWMAINVRPRRLGSRATLIAPDRSEHELIVPLVGAFNIANALAAVAGLARMGYRVEELCAGLARAAGVPGRMERIDAGQDFLVVVDYAHKPDAVEAVLRALRPVTPGRLIVVLGAGGDRDRGKRALMGRIGGRDADVLVVTDDNPRSEDPAGIRAELLAGAQQGSARVVEIADRAEAIAVALGEAREGDTVVIAGKGHERGQEIAGTIHPFDDREVARDWLEAAR